MSFSYGKDTDHRDRRTDCDRETLPWPNLALPPGVPSPVPSSSGKWGHSLEVLSKQKC